MTAGPTPNLPGLQADAGGETHRAQAQVSAFGAPRAGLTIAGFEVEHLHVHVFPAYTLENFSFATVDNNPDPAVLDANAEKIRTALRADGHGELGPGPPNPPDCVGLVGRNRSDFGVFRPTSATQYYVRGR